MALPSENVSMALYCDFENVALGVRDSKFNKFDIKPVLERLLLKGSIVVKKAYCDWDRYKDFKPQMHEASFELIEIPHVRQSGKNSADIRLVVDALDLCYTKSHVNTFVIISGDSDFSPLVSKLRENAKFVIGVGVKDSTSDLLIANCDEFIFIDDLLRESRRSNAKRETKQAPAAARQTATEEPIRKEEVEARKAKALDIAIETFDALMAERGENGKIWASTLKQAIKRRKPDFNETYFGFKTFGNLLEEAQARGMIELGRDERSGAFVSRSATQRPVEVPAIHAVRPQPVAVETRPMPEAPVNEAAHLPVDSADDAPVLAPSAAALETQGTVKEEGAAPSRGKGRKSTPRKRAPQSLQEQNDMAAVNSSDEPADPSNSKESAAKRTAAPRTSRRRKSSNSASSEEGLQLSVPAEEKA